MSILDTVKDLLGDKVGGAIDGVTSKATDMAADMMNFDDINVETLKSYADKFGITDMLPEAVKSKLADGTLSDEDLKSFIPEIKEMLMSKVGMGK